MCSVFWLFWLSYQYLPSDWQVTPLRKPNRGKGIVSRKPRPKSTHDFLGLLYCFIVLLCICVVSCPYVIYYVMARYSLFLLKVPLNPKQTNKQTSWRWLRPSSSRIWHELFLAVAVVVSDDVSFCYLRRQSLQIWIGWASGCSFLTIHIYDPVPVVDFQCYTPEWSRI